MRRAEILKLLPEVFQRTATPGNPLLVFLDAMERLQAPSEAVLAGIDARFDPRRAPPEFVLFLARWVDLDRLLAPPRTDGGPRREARALSTGIGRLRELIAAAAELSQWRGTSPGLVRFLEVATGLTGFEISEEVAAPGSSRLPFHVRIRAPAGSAPHRELLQRIIESEKPAYVTYELEIAPGSEGRS